MSAIPVRLPASPCIGRDAELGQLRSSFEAACRSGERLVLIRGPSGVGKTRLIEEFRGRMRLEGTVVLEGRCTSGGRALAPAAEILRGALRFLEEVGRGGEVDITPLAFLLDDDASAEPGAPGMTRLERRVRFFESYCGLLRHLGRIRPPVILVHDVDRADPATVELLGHLLDGAGPWLDSPHGDRTLYGLVVASTRGDEAGESVRRLAAHPKAQVLELQGFDAGALRAYLDDPAVVGRILEVTRGNPAELQALLDAPEGGADSALRRRVEALGRDARRLLAALAVLDRPAEAGMVTRVAGVASAARGLAELIDSGLVVKTVRHGEILLRPARFRVVELVYEWLPGGERRELHLRAARALDGAVGLAAQDLARHAIRGGDAATALPAALDAALALELGYAYEAAARLLEEARELASEAERCTLSERLAELYTHTGEYRRALAHAAEVLAARPGDPAARLALGTLHTLAGDYDDAAAALDALAGDLARSGKSPDAAVEAARAEVRFWRGEYDEARQICIAAPDGPAPTALALSNMLGKIDLTRGDHGAARRAFEGNLEAARLAGLEREQAHALINLAIVCLRQARHDAAGLHLDEALAIARRIGALRESAIALENLAVLAHFRRDYGRALDCYHAAVADMKRLGNRALLARAANNLGELYLRLGDSDRARRLGAFAEQMAGEDPPRSIVAEGLLLRARAALAEGAPAEARSSLERARALFDELGERGRVVEAVLARGRAELRDGDLTSARTTLASIGPAAGLDASRRAEAALLESDIEAAGYGDPLRPALVAVEAYEECGDPDGAFRAHLRAALLLRDAGDHDGFRRHLDRSAALEAQVAATVPETFAALRAADPDRARLIQARAERDYDERHAGQHRAAPRPAVSFLVREVGEAPNPRPAPLRSPTGIVYRSEAMRQVLEVAERAAGTDSLVLIRGESGTGKELVADALHRLSPRASRPFVKVNCGALVETLLLSELFGHEKGAFTGALQRRKGRFEAADGGTLFLDEIGDISPATQVSLLRVLQEQQFERVGGSTPIRTDVRIICATNRDLEELVREGLFREDLYYRLKGIQVYVPPLRERPEDVEALAAHFLEREAKARGEAPLRLDRSALATLVRHSWPGNVRELENVMRTVSIFVDGAAVSAAHLAEFAELEPSTEPYEPGEPLAAVPALAAAPPALPAGPVDPMALVREEVLEGRQSLSEMKKLVERQCIEAALDRTGGNITRAAELLGMKRPRLSQLVKEHGMARGAETEKVNP